MRSPSVGRWFATIAVAVSLISLALPSVPAYATACQSFVTNNGTRSFTISITGADGSCVSPTSYDASGSTPGRAHVALSSGGAQNPYTITLISCVPTSDCPPSNVKVLGWGPGDECGGSKPACPGSLPFSFKLDATVESNVSGCDDTAPLKLAGNSGAPILIIEGGSECVPHLFPPPPTVPEFPMGLALLFALAIPLMVLMKKRGIGISA